MFQQRSFKRCVILILIALLIFYRAWAYADSTGAAGAAAGWEIGGYTTRANDGIGGSYGGYYLAYYWGGCSMGNPFAEGRCACPSGYTAGFSGQNIDQFGDQFLEFQCYKR
ncbi:MAG: hypothetical protein ABFD12_00275 [Syntrophorhabdus sp.]